MANDMGELPPSVTENEPAPLRVIPRVPDKRTEFIKDTLATAVVIATVASVLYIVTYAISLGWHDGSY